MRGSKENCFSVNYANYFSRLIKPLHEYYSFNFHYNFIKKIIAEENVPLVYGQNDMCNEWMFHEYYNTSTS